MKILIISDSHSNIANLKHVMGFAKNTKADAVIHAGDWNTIESIETVLSYGLPLYSVLGNADIGPEVEKMLSSKCKKFDRVFLALELNGKRIGVIHSINNLQRLNHSVGKIDNLDVIFYGHNHRQSESDRDGTKIINPGALENNINFAVYDTNSAKIEFVHE